MEHIRKRGKTYSYTIDIGIDPNTGKRKQINKVGFLRSHEEWKDRVGKLFENQDLVICTNTGSVQDPHNVIRVMKRIVKIIEATNIRFHDILHTHASILISEGVDIVKISNRLGHTSPKTTLEFYAHLLPNSDNNIADIFHNAVQNDEL